MTVNGTLQMLTSVELSHAGFAGPNGFFGGAGASFLRLGLTTPLQIATIETIDVLYTQPSAGARIRDLAFNEMATTSVTSELAQTGPMSFMGATVDYAHGTDRILLGFSEPLDLSSIPPASDFVVKVNGTRTAVTLALAMTDVGVGLVDLVLPRQLSGSETLLVSYAPTSTPVTGRYSGLRAGGFTDAPVDYFLPLNGAAGTVAPGGTATTFYADGPTVSDPLATSVTSPMGGVVTITEQPLEAQSNAGYTFFGQQVLISAPNAADINQPLLFRFDLHSTLVPDGETAASIAILRNNVPVEECAAIAPSPAVATPTPCVWERVDQPDGGVSIAVATMQASRWNFGRPTPIAFDGFAAPVGNPPIRNGMKAGSAVPLKFSLGGNRGLAIFAPGSPSSQPVACDTGTPFDAVEQTVSAGGSNLRYDSSTDRYTYVWKTQRAWKGCRILRLTFADGSVQEAVFELKP